MDQAGRPGHVLRFSVLVGPMAEWFVYDIAEEGEFFELAFATMVEEILMAEDGAYEDIAWYLSEAATEALAQND